MREFYPAELPIGSEIMARPDSSCPWTEHVTAWAPYIDYRGRWVVRVEGADRPCELDPDQFLLVGELR